MDWSTGWDLLLSTQVPVLPDALLMRWGRRLSWGLLLATGLMWAGRRWPLRLQRVLAVLVLVGSLWPGPVSPSFWLGLAFQAPSLTTVLLCAVALWRLWCGLGGVWRANGSTPTAWFWAAWAGLGLGWLLLFDIFDVLPGSLYAGGFSPRALVLWGAGSVSLWVGAGARPGVREVVALCGGVAVLYVALRLPSGNLWDAVLDPWLWLGLHALVLRQGLRWFKTRRHASAAIRA